MKTNKNYPSCFKIVKKIITFKHRGKDFLYESLAPENLPVNVERYEILEGIKKENIKNFKVKTICFESEVEDHLCTWFVKPTKELEVTPKTKKDLSNNNRFSAQQKLSKTETKKGNKRSLKNQASYKSSLT